MLVVLASCFSCRASPATTPPPEPRPAADAGATATTANPAPARASPPSTTAPASAAASTPSPPATASLAPPATLAVTDGGTCAIHITHVVDAQVFRGPGRDSPSRQAAMERLSPKERAQWHGRDHGLLHTRCTYAVTMNGKRYRYEHIAAQTLSGHQELDPALCHQQNERQKVQDDLVNTTRLCTDPHAGAYWGFDLIEEP
jgi:hypothetical protein